MKYTTKLMEAIERQRLLCWCAGAGLLVLLAVVYVRGCLREREVDAAVRVVFPPPTEDEKGDVLVTGYCSCGECCGWRLDWLGFGRPVYTYGSQEGQPKKVGVTARGTVAQHGTVAADPHVYPFGTRLLIPGYGTGVVEDVGGSIKGRHIDVWFPYHQTALAWGRRYLKVQTLP